MKRILALDVGDIRIGIAVSDIMGIIANPLETYNRKKTDDDFDYIVNLCKEREVGEIVVGLPLSMNAQENVQTEKTRLFVETLKTKTDIPIKYVDERLTSVAAERLLIDGGVRRENRKKVIDKVAATLILQSYLDFKK